MKKLLLLFLLAFNANAFEYGTADQTLVVPHAGGRMVAGQLDLSKSAAVKNQLGPANGGFGISTSASTGVPSVSGGTWSINSTLASSLGGLGGNFGSSTGALSISSGTVTAGTLGHANGGTDITSPGASGNVLVSNGTNWTSNSVGSAFTVPGVDKLTATGTRAGSYFVVTSANATLGATYTNNGNTFTVLSTIASGTTLWTSGASAPLTSGTLTKSSGTGDATITFSAATQLASYTIPNPAPLYLHIRMTGGGGGGSGSGSGGAGGAGTFSVFGPNLAITNGGGGAAIPTSGSLPGAGGTVTVTSPAIDSGLTQPGGAGMTGGIVNASSVFLAAGQGGVNAFGGACGPTAGNSTAGTSIAVGANTGAGGCGGENTTSSVYPGGGGGASGYADFFVPNPSAGALYYYAIGAGGAAGTAGNAAGYVGSAGRLVVQKMYQ